MQTHKERVMRKFVVALCLFVFSSERSMAVDMYPERMTLNVGEEALLMTGWQVGTLFNHVMDWEYDNNGVIEVTQQVTRSYPEDLKGDVIVTALEPGEAMAWAYENGRLVGSVYIEVLLAPSLSAPVLHGPNSGRVFRYPGPVANRWLDLEWDPVLGASGYQVDIQGCRGFDWLQEDWEDCSYYFNALEPPFRSPPYLENFVGVGGSSFTWNFAGDQPGRWRIRAIDEWGDPGSFSEWRTFKFEYHPWMVFESDFNQNGVIDFNDFFMFSDAFGRLPVIGSRWEKFDLDGDASINFSDFFIFADAFNSPLTDGLAKPGRVITLITLGPSDLERVLDGRGRVDTISYGELKSKW